MSDLKEILRERRGRSTNMRPEVGEFDETVPDQESSGEVKVLGNGGGSVLTLFITAPKVVDFSKERRKGEKRTNLVESKLETQNLGDRVAPIVLLDTNLNRCLPLPLCVRLSNTVLTLALRRPRRDSEEVEEETVVRDALVREGIEKDIESAGGVEVEVTCFLALSILWLS
jgi:hypothetical protein